VFPLKVGGDVSPPRPLYAPNPEYSEKAREAGYQGSCVLRLTVGEDGKPQDTRIERGLGMGLDERAIDAVRRWTFEPARKNGKPVAVVSNDTALRSLFPICCPAMPRARFRCRPSAG